MFSIFFFWIFLIDVMKLEYGKVLLLSSFPMCSWIVHLCNSPSTLVSLQNFLLAFPHNLLQVSSPLQLDLLLLVTCTNISIRQVMLMKLHILLNLIVKSEFYLKGLDFTLLQHTTWIYSVFEPFEMRGRSCYFRIRQECVRSLKYVRQK